MVNRYQQKKNSKKTIKEVNMITKIGILCSLSIGMLLIPGGGWPIFPFTPWLKYDMVDIPIILGSLLLGLPSSMTILSIVAAFQSLLLDSDGWVGFFMHVVASGTLISIIYLGNKKWSSFIGLIMSSILAILSMLIVMIVLNLYFIPLVYPITFEQALTLLPWTIAFNVIKSGLNIFLTILIWKSIIPFFKKNKKNNIIA